MKGARCVGSPDRPRHGRPAESHQKAMPRGQGEQAAGGLASAGREQQRGQSDQVRGGQHHCGGLALKQRNAVDDTNENKMTLNTKQHRSMCVNKHVHNADSHTRQAKQ
jgi:hypothetical protein